jgi:hypothetical protein
MAEMLLVELFRTPKRVSSIPSNGGCDGSVFTLKLPSVSITSKIAGLVSSPIGPGIMPVKGGLCAFADEQCKAKTAAIKTGTIRWGFI